MKSFEINIEDERTDKPELTKEELSEIMARMYTTPSGSNSLALCALNDADWGAMSDRLKEINSDVLDGDITIGEALLIDQAIVLQSIFSSYTSKMASSDYLSQVEAFGKIALRAQNQCQRTLRTLLEYKNPKRTMFIKQQNNATNQQINEGGLKDFPEKKVNPANELLEENHEARMDTGKTREAVTVNSEVETVGELDRTAHGTG